MAKFVLTAQLQLQAPKNVASVVKQIQDQLRGVQVNVQAKGTAETQRKINDLTASTDKASASVNRMGKAFEASVRRFSALAIATRAVSLFTNTLGGAVREAISFERELIKISQVTGKTMSDLRDLTDSITNLSTTFGVSSSSLLNVSRILSQAGFSAEETEIALKTLAKTDLAPTFDDITQTAEGAVAIFNQFKQGAEALETQLGAINAVAGKFAVEAGDLISVLRRTGGVFQASGGDLNELIALFTSVRATTRESAESIATGLRTIFTRIQRPRTIEYLKQFGVELVDLNGKFVGPYEATKRLSQALSGLEQGDITFIKIAEELGGFRQIGKVIPLLQQFQVSQEALNVAQEGSTSLAQDAAKAQQTLAVRLSQVQEKFVALIRSISETASFQLMANTAIALAESIVKVGDAIKPVLPLLSALAAFKLVKGFAGFTGNISKNLQGFSGGGKIHTFATGGMVPGSGNRDTVPAMLTPGEFVIRKSSVAKLGAGNLEAMNNNRYAKGGKQNAIQKGAQSGDVGIFDSDMISDATQKKLVLEQIKASKKPYQVIAGPAGAGKTTFATGRFGKNFVMSAADIDKYSKFVVLSGAGKTKTGDFSDNTKSLLSGASEITVLSPSPERLMAQRQGRLDAAMSGQLPDTRSVSGLQGTLKAPTDINEDLYRPYNNVNLVREYANAGAVKPISRKEQLAQIQAKTDAEVARLRQEGGERSKETLQLKPGIVGGVFLQKGSGGTQGINISLQGQQLPSNFPQGATSIKGSITTSLLKTQASDQLRKQIEPNIANAVQQAATNTIKSLELSPLDIDESSAAKKAVNKIDLTSIEGYIFEAFTSALTGLKLSDAGATFDYVNPSARARNRISDIFSNSMPTESLIDAKRTLNSESVQSGKSSIAKKILASVMNGTLGPQYFQKFATGGPVGTDTVPALLTPGEFVVNKRSAQRIGYGSLNRMNKVGKYAKGGVVQRFADGTSGSGVSAMSSTGGNFINLGDVVASAQLEKELQDTAKSAKNATSALAKYGAGVFAVTTALNQMLPAVQENEGAALRFTRAMTDSVTQVVGSIGTLGFALQGLGERFEISNLMQNKYVAGLTAATAAAALVSAGLEALYDSTNSYNKAVKEGNVAEANRLATASSTAGARQVATVGAGAGVAGIAALFGLTNPIGLLVTGVVAASAAFGLLNAKADTFQDFLSLFGAQTANQVKAQTAAKIATQNFTIELQKASERAASAFQEAEGSGNFAGVGERVFGDLVSSLDELKKSVRSASDATTQASRPIKTSSSNQGFFGGLFRSGAQRQFDTLIGTKTGESTNKEYAEKIEAFFADSSNLVGSVEEVQKRFAKQINGLLAPNPKKFEKIITEYQDFFKRQSEALNSSRSFINQSFRSASISGQFSSGISKSLLKARDTATANLKEKDLGLGNILDKTPKSDRERVLTETKTSLENTVKGSSVALVRNLNDIVQSSNQLSPSLKKLITSLPTDQAVELARSLTNIGAEIERLRKRFELINLGLSPFNANVIASNVALNNYLSAVDGSSTQLERSLNTLNAALSASGSAISSDDFNSSLETVTKTLEQYGASTKVITETQKKFAAARTTQNILQDYLSGLDENNFKDLKSVSDVKSAQEKIADVLSNKLQESNIDKIVASQIVSSFRDNPPSEALTKAFDQGDISGFQNALSEISSEFVNQLSPAINKVIENEKALNGALQKRIDAENKLYSAQTQALSIALEAARIQSDYGGKFLSTADKLANLTSAINTGSGAAGLSPVSATTSGLQTRIEDIAFEFQKLSTFQALDPSQKAQQERLLKLSSETITQARELIKIRQEEYDIIRKRNQLEKDSIQSLISGDVDSFFRKQAAEGALGAISLGRSDLAQQFGGEALSDGIDYLRQLRDAGIQTFQGQKISGSKGLEEQARVVALLSRGLSAESARRGAEIGADTTPELNDLSAKIRDAADTLRQAGNLQQTLSTIEVANATNVYINAQNFIPNFKQQAVVNNQNQDIKAGGEGARFNIRVDAQDLTSIDNTMKKFGETTKDFQSSIDKLSSGIQLKLDKTNVVVTLNGSSILEKMPQFVLDIVKPEIIKAIDNIKIGPDGKLRPSNGSGLG